MFILNHKNRFLLLSNPCSTRTNMRTVCGSKSIWERRLEKKRHTAIWESIYAHYTIWTRSHKVFIALMLLMMSICSRIVFPLYTHTHILPFYSLNRSHVHPHPHTHIYQFTTHNILLYLFRENTCVDMNSFWRGFNFTSVLMKMRKSHTDTDTHTHSVYGRISTVRVYNGNLFTTICDCTAHLKRIAYILCKMNRSKHTECDGVWETKRKWITRGNSSRARQSVVCHTRKSWWLLFHKCYRIHVKYIRFTSHCIHLTINVEI